MAQREGPELPDVMASYRNDGTLRCYRYSPATLKRRHMSRWDSSKAVLTYMEALDLVAVRGGGGDVYPCGDHWHITRREFGEPIPAKRKKEKVVTAKTLSNRRRRAATAKRRAEGRDRHKTPPKVEDLAYLQKYLPRPVEPLLTREELHQRWGWK
ncbi:hypothetical protein KHQ84_gp127 [Rhodococcus phage Finch]|uniref:Uncharacterized protein n=1 Tax=Rhodococcus phage Finch TaxID=2094144 RepID=A0A2P1JXJ6_9CAUD|nr:hypothetical protein KHQ84_gp127 [Rhodococcus phage Finch]AVO25058.1 hypothetical protein SEA_FINCH_127 [Rhodococcus phage Finch]